MLIKFSGCGDEGGKNVRLAIALGTKYQTLRSLYGVRSPFVVSDDRSPKIKERSHLSNSQPTKPTYSALYFDKKYAFKIP
ncbi:MAG: hypothetical protein P2A85_27535 [Microcoleus anatoxicus]|uniref:hypothetical protein n=1 Tax=Microcoleus anatoxicus TaxID=2705319 RepID=UPI00366CA84D